MNNQAEDDRSGNDNQSQAAQGQYQGRWRLIRDAFTFQFKLAVDGLRDLVFSPISILFAFLDLITGGDRFYRLLELGRRSELWINLFGRYDGDGHGIDEGVKKVEMMIAEQYEKGGITASAKRSVDKALNRLSTENRRDQD